MVVNVMGGGGRRMRPFLGLSLMRWCMFLLPRVGMLAFIGYICFLGWSHLGPRKPVPDYPRQLAADKAVEKIVEEIRMRRGTTARSAVLCHFANDPSDCLSHKLRRKLESSGILNLTDMGFAEKFRTQINLRNAGVATEEAALAEAEGCAVDCVLWGAVDRFESAKGGVLLTGKWSLVAVPGGGVICDGAIREDTISTGGVSEIVDGLSRSTDELELAASAIPWHLRFLGVVLVVLLLPVVTISFVRTMVAKRSNRINAFMLAIYTTLDAILAFFMVGGTFASSGQVFLFLLSVAGALGYNVALMTFALRLELDT